MKKKSIFRKKLMTAAVSLAASFALTLTSFPVPARAAETESESESTTEDKYLTEFPENKEIPLTNLNIPYEDVCYVYQERPEKYVILPGDTVVFTPDEIELTEQIGYYGQKELKGSGTVDFLPIHDPDDTYVPKKELSESSFINGATYQVGTIKSNGTDYETNAIPDQTEVSERTAKVGFVNDSDSIIRFAGSAGWGPYDKLEVFDMSGGAPAAILSIYYRQHSMEYKYVDVDHYFSYTTEDSDATWQGSESLLPKKYSIRNNVDKYTLYFPCPVAEGKHFWQYYITADEEGGYTPSLDLNVFYNDNDYNVKGQRMIAYNYELTSDYDSQYGDYTLKALFIEGDTMTLDGNGGTVEGQSKWIAELDSVPSEEKYVYAGTSRAINLNEDFNVVRDGYTVAGWYYMIDEDGTEERHAFYGFGDDRTYYTESYGLDYYLSNEDVKKLYPVWVDSEGNYSDPNTGLTTPLEEVIIPKEDDTTEDDTTEDDTTEGDSTESDTTEDDNPGEEITNREFHTECTYDADKYEDGFIAIASYKYYENGVEITDAPFYFTPADDETLAEFDAKGIHFMDPRIAAAGYDENTIAAFVDYDGSWTESSFLSYKVGFWDNGSGTWKIDTYINMPYNKPVWITDNSATGEGAAAKDSFVIEFEDYFNDYTDYKAYVYDELSGSGKAEVEKTLAANEKALACFTTMLMVDNGNGPSLINNKDVLLFFRPDENTFERCDEYVWYELKNYKKAGSFDPEFSSAGIGANVKSTGTYLLVGINHSTSIEKATVSGLKTSAYTGKAITPAVTVKLDGKTLKKGTDYDVTYANNTKAGTATVTITGKGDYSGTITKKFLIKKINFKYRAYVQKKNWMSWSTANVSGTSASTMAGTTDNLRMETIQMQLAGVSGEVKYRAYVEKIGWTQWATTADTKTYAGTKGMSRRVEMIQLNASGQVATLYDMYYRAYSEKFGWLGWAKSGEKAGSAGYARKLEAFQVNFVRKGESFKLTSDRTKCFYDKSKDGANPK
ncbi:MAG: hypothetical protein IKO61_03210 [Lachnospiraceae bacterium]|nr:hypothetical protein [Lachnospiraceae bacterium]